MEFENLLLAAIQSSFLLGLLHGVNPCGHSWLVLVPFVSGEKKGSRIMLLTVMFLSGTSLACLVLGASLGAVSTLFPSSMGRWVELVTSLTLLVLGILLLYNPHILHNHDHEHDHEHNHSHDNGMLAWLKRSAKNKKVLSQALFGIGFVNMIIPCPTAAVMYTYALNSGSVFQSIVVFGTYAISTSIAVGAVIYLIFKATQMAHSLQKDWIEPMIMRVSGVVIIIFSGYGLLEGFITV